MLQLNLTWNIVENRDFSIDDDIQEVGRVDRHFET